MTVVHTERADLVVTAGAGIEGAPVLAERKADEQRLRCLVLQRLCDLAGAGVHYLQRLDTLPVVRDDQPAAVRGGHSMQREITEVGLLPCRRDLVARRSDGGPVGAWPRQPVLVCRYRRGGDDTAQTHGNEHASLSK